MGFFKTPHPFSFPWRILSHEWCTQRFILWGKVNLTDLLIQLKGTAGKKCIAGALSYFPHIHTSLHLSPFTYECCRTHLHIVFQAYLQSNSASSPLFCKKQQAAWECSTVIPWTATEKRYFGDTVGAFCRLRKTKWHAVHIKNPTHTSLYQI